MRARFLAESIPRYSVSGETNPESRRPDGEKRRGRHPPSIFRRERIGSHRGGKFTFNLA
jgi:hypothetical protein